MTREIRFAFIGTGGVAMLHAEAMRRVDNARLVGAWSPTPEHVAIFTTTQGIRAYRSLDELLDDRAIEAVAVLTAADSHFDLALKCLEAGKHVLVEKPVARSLNGARSRYIVVWHLPMPRRRASIFFFASLLYASARTGESEPPDRE
jgi:predicted dehydrogenase